MTKDEKWLLEEKYGGVASPAFEEDRVRLAKGEPLAYVIGWTPFLGLKIHLDSHPLIPRPETEWWTERMLETLAPKAVSGPRHYTFLDLCSGSGAIGCAVLAKLSNADVYFGEVDSSHDVTIRKNISKNDLDLGRAHIGIGDLLEPFGDTMFDFIAANPPYIPTERVIPESVAAWEPSLALRAGEDGLRVIERIAAGLPSHLAHAGIAWIECDSAHATAACALFETEGFTAVILNDQYDAPRVIMVSRGV